MIVQTVVTTRTTNTSSSSSGCHGGLDNVGLSGVGALAPAQDLDVVSRHQARGALTSSQ